jgi:hypothetical protein
VLFTQFGGDRLQNLDFGGNQLDFFIDGISTKIVYIYGRPIWIPTRMERDKKHLKQGPSWVINIIFP